MASDLTFELTFCFKVWVHFHYFARGCPFFPITIYWKIYPFPIVYFCLLCYKLLFSLSVVSNSLAPHGLQHTRLPCPSPSPGPHSNSRPLSQWCHPTISSLAVPFSSCPQPFPASGSFLVSWLFASGGQSIGASASPFHIWSFTGTQSCWLGYVLSIYCVSSYSAELSSCDTELEATGSEIYYPALFRKSLLTSVLISCLMRKTSGVRGRVLKWSMDIGDRYKPRLRQRR